MRGKPELVATGSGYDGDLWSKNDAIALDTGITHGRQACTALKTRVAQYNSVTFRPDISLFLRGYPFLCLVQILYYRSSQKVKDVIIRLHINTAARYRMADRD